MQSSAKMKELILHIATECRDDETFGAIKLNKILFYSDFLAYAHFGQSITGQRYFKLPFGPAPRSLLPVQGEMERAGEISLASMERYTQTQKRIIPLREPNLSGFSAEELDLVGQVIEELRPLNATEASDFSHTFLGWELVEMRDDIPYETVFLSREVPDDEHVTRLLSVVAENGWALEPVS